MLTEESEKFSNKLEPMSTDEIERKLAEGAWGSGNPPDNQHYKIAKFILEKRKAKEEKEKFERTLNIATDNVKATKNLVKATWALFGATAILALSPLLAKVLNFILTSINKSN